MGKRNRNRKNHETPRPSQNRFQGKPPNTAPANQTVSQVAVDIDKLHRAAVAGAVNGDLLELDTHPKLAPDAQPEELVELGNQALALLKVQTDRAAQAEESARNAECAAAEMREKLTAEELRIRKLEEDLETRAKGVAAAQSAQEESERALVKRQADLLKREADADAGFLARNRSALAELEKAVGEMRDEFSTHRKRIFTEREAWEAELQKKRSTLEVELVQRRSIHGKELETLRAEWEAEVAKQRSQLDERDEQLRSEASRLRKEAQNNARDRELIDEDRQGVAEKAAQRAAAAIEHRDAQFVAIKEQLEAARKDRDDLSRTLAEREEADTRFGNLKPEEVLREMRALKKDKAKLEKSLGERPGADALQRLEDLSNQRDSWQTERLQLLEEVSRLRQELQARRIVVTEMEGLRNHKAALEASNELLRMALEEELKKVNDLIRSTDGASPFPSCSKMDVDPTVQSNRTTQEKTPDLKVFAESVQHRMAYDPETGKSLFYSIEDVRSFIAGLAMSRLHLLQGISGTGKTSLPLAFARAVGAGWGLIEVQAGWRDRQDLIGHFNAFERRFYESEFLLALYKAGCPQFKDTPFIIVLDEMNLSHPEQYFADLLSALEQDQQRQKLVLMTAACHPAPKLLKNGKDLQIPPNVWFVGTANHDETTKDFADKTYDRAHVMELPQRRAEFKVTEQRPSQPVAMAALRASFDNAAKNHHKEAVEAYKFLDDCLAEPLGQRFSVGWGNRLERQMQAYVPVVIASGGSIGEATDHILATKLLRKIQDRHDNRPEDILALRDRIKKGWSRLGDGSDAVKSLAILQRELRRLGQDED